MSSSFQLLFSSGAWPLDGCPKLLIWRRQKIGRGAVPRPSISILDARNDLAEPAPPPVSLAWARCRALVSNRRHGRIKAAGGQ
jgi:hypothetical protein